MVVHQSKPYLEPLVESLLRESQGLCTEIVLVDSRSTDGGPELVEARFPNVMVVRMRSNWGFAAGCNVGRKRTRAPFLLFLNPDVVLLPGSLDSMVSYLASNRDVGVLGCRLLNPDGTLQLSCRRFYNWKSALLRRTPLGKLRPHDPELISHLMLDYDHARPAEVDWVLGTCLMTRRGALEEVGGMDDRFFLYFEDVDVCYRMKRHGWRVVYYPEAAMIHHHARQSARGWAHLAAWLHLRSMIRFHQKHGWSLLWRRNHNA